MQSSGGRGGGEADCRDVAIQAVGDFGWADAGAEKSTTMTMVDRGWHGSQCRALMDLRPRASVGRWREERRRGSGARWCSNASARFVVRPPATSNSITYSYSCIPPKSIAIAPRAELENWSIDVTKG